MVGREPEEENEEAVYFSASESDDGGNASTTAPSATSSALWRTWKNKKLLFISSLLVKHRRASASMSTHTGSSWSDENDVDEDEEEATRRWRANALFKTMDGRLRRLTHRRSTLRRERGGEPAQGYGDDKDGYDDDPKLTLKEWMSAFVKESKIDFEGRRRGSSDTFLLADRQRRELEAIGHDMGKSFLIHPQSYFKYCWDTVVVVATVVVCFQAPIRTCFTPLGDLIMLDEGSDDEFHASLQTWEVLNLSILFLVEIVFLFDLCIFLFVGVGYHRLGVVVMDRKMVRQHYLRTHFVWDLIAAAPIVFFPMTVISKVNGDYEPKVLYLIGFYMTLLQLTKIPSGLTRSMALRDSLSDSWGTTLCDMMMLILMFMILTNFFTCLWFLTLAYNPQTQGFDLWINSAGSDGSNWLTQQAENGDELVRDAINCWVEDNHLCNMRDKWVLYTNTFYWASNSGDGFDTVQTLEKVTAIVVTVVFNNGFFAFIIASVSFGLQQFNRGYRKRAEYRIKIDGVNAFMASHAVRPAVAAEVREYYASVWLPRQVDFTESSLMSELPPRLSRKVMRDITIGVILGSQFYERYFKQKEKEKEWRHIKEWIELTAENVEPRYFVPQQYIVKQGERGTELFILKSGKVSVLINAGGGQEKMVATLGPGAYFGDLSLLGLTDRRSASVVSVTNATVYILAKDKFEDILDQMPDQGSWLRGVMLDVAKSYQRRDERMNNESAWDESACSQAAEGGHLEILEWLRSEGCRWDEERCRTLGEPNIVRWIDAQSSSP